MITTQSHKQTRRPAPVTPSILAECVTCNHIAEVNRSAWDAMPSAVEQIETDSCPRCGDGWDASAVTVCWDARGREVAA
jgi:hypothetical protein